MKFVNVIGAGLAGSEAAYQLAKRGIQVKLYEMRPVKNTPAHHTQNFAELVCSNSLRADGLANAVGVLKEEMRILDSLIMKAADANAVPAGGALAVDREGFSGQITEFLSNHPNIEVIREELTEIPEGPTIVATGPLTSDALSAYIREMTGHNSFYFYDAAAPIIEKDSINFDKVYLKSRYDKGEAAYLNCPMSEEEFNAWHEALINAEVVPVKEFEKEVFFEGCMPIEGEQKRIVQMIPGLENAEIVRYGVMHRNSFINSPVLLRPTYQFKTREDLFFAGQLTGVEGYVESAASGMVAGINMAKYMLGEELIEFPRETAMGSMAYYITHTSQDGFQPMNANFGLFLDLPGRVKKKEKKALYAARAIEKINECKELI